MPSVLVFKAKAALDQDQRAALLHTLASHQSVAKADWASARGIGARGLLILNDAADPQRVAQELANVPGLERPPAIPPDRRLIP